MITRILEWSMKAVLAVMVSVMVGMTPPVLFEVSSPDWLNDGQLWNMGIVLSFFVFLLWFVLNTPWGKRG